MVKSRVQLADKPPANIGYLVNAFRDIYKKEGAKAFIAGLSPTMLRAVPAAASTFVAFEITMDLLLKHTEL